MLLFPRQFLKIRFNLADLIGNNAFKVTQIVKDLTLEIDFSAVALADLIEFIDHIAQVRADFLYFFVTLTVLHRQQQRSYAGVDI